jgi:hypothetical protein
MKAARIGFASILVLLLFSPSYAQDAETAADVRCLVVGIQMSRSLDATQRASGSMVVMYYLGRLDKALPGPNLEQLIANEASQISATEFKAEATRCGKSLVEKGQLLQRIGNDLTIRGKQQDGDKATSSH